MHLRTPLALAFFSAAFVAACSSDAPSSNDVGQPAPDVAGVEGDHADEGEGGGFAPPSDDPNIGADVDVDRATPPATPPKGTPPAHVPSPVPGKNVTYAFGVKNPRYAAGYHTGDDYATPTGSNAVAVRSGTIRFSNDAGGAYGKWIGLDADNGRTYVYCHLSSRLVAAGTKVTAGQVIAKTGATGNVTGPHLHFEDHPLGPFVYAQVRKPSW